MAILDFFLHIDKYLQLLIASFGSWSYVILFLVIFCETGLVFTPFLPGDSLLFAIGSFAALGSFSLPVILMVIFLAAVLGDNSNYWIGRNLGRSLLKSKWARWIKPEYIQRAEHFYRDHGANMIFLARFMPIVRTFAPFVAGMADMPYTTFLPYSFLGGVIWVNLFVLAGYFFGQVPFVQEHFSIVALVIVLISILPMLRHYFFRRKA